ncbi:hypothetical protein GXW82_12250 [Streptacidiphilus sp. 4-A2]|nr:hypothetical protein [Streptacidiphilus sp. 4-A2]
MHQRASLGSQDRKHRAEQHGADAGAAVPGQDPDIGGGEKAVLVTRVNVSTMPTN